jgi:hypothetical protein
LIIEEKKNSWFKQYGELLKKTLLLKMLTVLKKDEKKS